MANAPSRHLGRGQLIAFNHPFLILRLNWPQNVINDRPHTEKEVDLIDNQNPQFPHNQYSFPYHPINNLNLFGHLEVIYAIGFAPLSDPCQNHGMRVVSVGGSQPHRLAIVILLIVGLVGMHHLVSVTCSAAFSEHGVHHSTAPANAPAPVDAQTPVNPETSTDHNAGQGTQAQPIDLGSVCIAILFVISLAIPSLRATVRRKRISTALVLLDTRALPATHPPELKRLSISRT